MRLKPEKVKFIKENFLDIFKAGDVYLFGSRVDDDKRGGDIDLLFITKHISRENIRKFRIEFFKKFGEQKLDIVADDGSLNPPFVKMIFQKAVKL